MMPSKASGKRIAAVRPSRPPVEPPVQYTRRGAIPYRWLASAAIASRTFLTCMYAKLLSASSLTANDASLVSAAACPESLAYVM